MEPSEAWESLKLKFDSGNNIKVDRITLTREEYEAIQKFDIHCVENDTVLLYFKCKKEANKFVSKTLASDGLRSHKILIC